MTPTLFERVWSKVRVGDGCWEWTGTYGARGYGAVWFEGAMIQATHAVWFLVTGDRVPTGLHVLHTCDNPPCVRPSHLWLGTRSENMRDMVSKGRAAPRQGEWHPLARLTEATVRAIRARGREGVPTRDVAAEFGIAERTVLNVQKGIRWGHVI